MKITYAIQFRYQREFDLNEIAPFHWTKTSKLLFSVFIFQQHQSLNMRKASPDDKVT